MFTIVAIGITAFLVGILFEGLRVVGRRTKLEAMRQDADKAFETVDRLTSEWR